MTEKETVLRRGLGEIEPNVFRIPKSRYGVVTDAVTKLNKRAEKTGCGGIELVVIREELIEVPVENEFGVDTGGVKVVPLVVVRLIGEVPIVNGYSFVARVEHTEAGNIISRAPGAEGVELPTELRDCAPSCDHCKKNRRRIDTFVLTDADTKLIRVGRNCLADFVRDDDVATALRLWSLLSSIRGLFAGDEDEGFGGGGYGESYLPSTTFLACTSSAIRDSGWVSKKAAYEDVSGRKISTASVALEIATPLPTRADAKAVAWWKAAQPNEDDFNEAAAIVEWAAELADRDDLNDYLHNLRVSVARGYVTNRDMGIVASAVMAFRRETAGAAGAVETAAKVLAGVYKKKANEWFGEVGERYMVEVTVTGTRYVESMYGTSLLVMAETEDGTSFKTFASGDVAMTIPGEDDECVVFANGPGTGTRDVREGDKVWIAGTVKKHDTYKDRKNTMLTRASATVERPCFKWVDDAGHIFKTRKALKAATEMAKEAA